jgi:hypothetical protein
MTGFNAIFCDVELEDVFEWRDIMIFFEDIVKHISLSSIMNVNCQKIDHLMTQN